MTGTDPTRVLTYCGVRGSGPPSGAIISTVEGLLQAHHERRADVIVVETPDALPALRRVLAQDASASVFVAGGSPHASAEAIRSGARGYLRRTVGSDPALPRAVQAAPRLTDRERAVLAAMSQGLTNAEIAGQLQVSEATVKVYAQHLFTKLRTRDRAQAVAAGFRGGLLS